MRSVRLERHTQRALLPYAFILPAVVALLLFSIYPFVTGIWYSFTSIGWAGDAGAAKLFKDALVHSVIWTVVVVGGQFVVGLGVALVLNERFPGRTLFR